MASEEDDAERLRLRYRALSRWENDGGSAGAVGDPVPGQDGPFSGEPPLTDAEPVQLRVRVIALENLVIALLTGASPSQREAATAMAAFISPRPGHTLHPMTLHAAKQMLSFAERSVAFGVEAWQRGFERFAEH